MRIKSWIWKHHPLPTYKQQVESNSQSWDKESVSFFWEMDNTLSFPKYS
jgi:hypothetical protein